MESREFGVSLVVAAAVSAGSVMKLPLRTSESLIAQVILPKPCSDSSVTTEEIQSS